MSYITFFQLFITPVLMATALGVVYRINKNRFHLNPKSDPYRTLQIEYHTYMINWHTKAQNNNIQKKK